MKFGAATSIPEFWKNEVLTRESDFIEAQKASRQSETTSISRAMRRAVDVAAALSALPDWVAVDFENNKEKLGNFKVNDCRLITLQIAYAKYLDKQDENIRALRLLNNKYKHRKRHTDYLELALGDQPVLAETSIIVAPACGGPSCTGPAAGGIMTDKVKIYFHWKNSEGSDCKSNFTTLFCNAKHYWTKSVFSELGISLDE
jgi:hypothetical protein